MSAVQRTRASFGAMQLVDLAEVVAVENAAYEFPWTLGNFRDALGSGYECRVFREDGAMTGYFVLMIAGGEAHLLNLCVAPDRQRQGIGRYLLDRALALARAHDALHFYLEVRPSNHAARMLYGRAGFRELGTRRDYYPARGGREDALVLQMEFA